MKSKDIEKILELLRKQTEELTTGPDAKQKCRDFLISTGIYNEDGSLSEDFGGVPAGSSLDDITYQFFNSFFEITELTKNLDNKIDELRSEISLIQNIQYDMRVILDAMVAKGYGHLIERVMDDRKNIKPNRKKD